jgi:hypothetical protein
MEGRRDERLVWCQRALSSSNSHEQDNTLFTCIVLLHSACTSLRYSMGLWHTLVEIRNHILHRVQLYHYHRLAAMWWLLMLE